MNMLYNLVAKSSDEAAAFFYQMMYRSHPDLERVSIECDPDVVYVLRKHREVRSWEVCVQSVRAHTPDGDGYPLLNEDGDM